MRRITVVVALIGACVLGVGGVALAPMLDAPAWAPTFFNTSGSINLTDSVSPGVDFAVLASQDVTISGTSTSITCTPPSSTCGQVLIVAGSLSSGNISCTTLLDKSTTLRGNVNLDWVIGSATQSSTIKDFKVTFPAGSFSATDRGKISSGYLAGSIWTGTLTLTPNAGACGSPGVSLTTLTGTGSFSIGR
jgi:hypothetical protein